MKSPSPFKSNSISLNHRRPLKVAPGGRNPSFLPDRVKLPDHRGPLNPVRELLMSSPELKEIDSLIRLLDDRDSFVFKKVRENIVNLGTPAVPYLRKAAITENTVLRQRALDVLDALHPVELKEKFVRFTRDAKGEDLDLEQGACLIMEFGGWREEGSVEVRHKLDELAEGLKPQLSPDDTNEETVRKLSKFLFQEQAFQGNQVEYFEPENSYLDRVLETRKGIPITLSLVCILVGRRLGLPIDGIGLPCHFIAKLNAPGNPVYFDPFNKGRILTYDSCVELVESFGLKFEEKFLNTSTSREILVRMLHNLITIFNRLQDEEKSAHLVELSRVLLGRSPDLA